MGLDMYAYVGQPGQHDKFWDTADSVQTSNGNGAVFVSSTVERPREIAYWRKHPNLHGWMEALWRQKNGGGDSDRFNGVELELTWDDIQNLEQDILAGCLPATQGFFFGQDADDHYRQQDLDFCAEARANLFLGQRVFYNSSW